MNWRDKKKRRISFRSRRCARNNEGNVSSLMSFLCSLLTSIYSNFLFDEIDYQSVSYQNTVRLTPIQLPIGVLCFSICGSGSGSGPNFLPLRYRGTKFKNQSILKAPPVDPGSPTHRPAHMTPNRCNETHLRSSVFRDSVIKCDQSRRRIVKSVIRISCHIGNYEQNIKWGRDIKY